MPYETAAMTFEKLVNLAKNYNKAGKVPKGAPKEVIIYEVLDQTATVKLVAEWGIDYINTFAKEFQSKFRYHISRSVH